MNNNMMTLKQFNEESKRKEKNEIEKIDKDIELNKKNIEQIRGKHIPFFVIWILTVVLATILYMIDHDIYDNFGELANMGTIPIGTIISPIIYIFCFIIKEIPKQPKISAIDKRNESLEEEKKNIIKAAEDERKKYSESYEREVQKRSVNFAESVLAKEVIEWMTKGFCKTIEAADRRSHIQKINVPFNFHVYSNKITCNLGTYDFELHRCANLTELMDQAALARAIVTEIQLNIRMKYLKDMSGTDFNLSIGYEYGDDSFSTSISYEAPNGYYKEVRKWDY